MEGSSQTSDAWEQRIFRYSIDMLGTANFDGYFTRLNPAWQSTLGYELEDLLNRPYIDFVHPDDEARTILEAQKLAEGALILSFENRYRCKDGAYKWISWRCFPDHDYNEIYFVARDVTPLKLLDADLKAHRDHLEEVVAQRTRELERRNRAYRTLSAGNHLLLRATDEKTLIREVCNAIVEIGGYGMTWMGYKVDDEAKTVRPVGWAGIRGSDIPVANLTWADVDQGRGVSGTAIRSGRPSVMQNLATDPNFTTYRTAILDLGLRSAAGYPLKIRDEVIGVLCVYSKEPDAFGPSETELLEEMAGDLAFGIETIRARTVHEAGKIELEQKNHRLESVYSVGQIVNSTLNLNEILTFVTDEAIRVAHAERGLILVADRIKGHFVQHALRGFTPDEVAHVNANPLPLTQGLNGQALKTGQIVRVDDVRENPHYISISESIRSELVIPILRNTEVLGNISLQSTQLSAFERTDVEYLRALAEQAAIAITNAQLYTELESYNEFLELAIADRTADLRATKDRVETILNSIGDALMVLALDGRIMQANRAFETQTGFTRVQAEGEDHHDLLKLQFGSKGDYQSALEILNPGQVWTGQTTVTRKDGTTYDADLTIAPVRDDGGTMHLLVAIIRDITPLKAAQRAKDEFVSNVSHELRTPITGIKLNYSMIERDPNRQEVYMGRLGREINRLNGLVEDLLRLSRLEHGRVELNLEPTDLNALGAQIVADREALAQTRGLTLRFDAMPDLPPATVDAGLLTQAISVLMTNAFNYTPSGGEVVVSSMMREKGKRGWVGLRIADNGPGIKPDEQARLFERFFRGTAGRASGAAGTGLGLNIARNIVDEHHGELEVFSEGIAGQGAAFTIWIPQR